MGHQTDPRAKALKSDERYDAKKAYDKNLSGKARLHYLENDIHDKGMSMKTPMDMKTPMKMGHSPAEMGHSPAEMKTMGSPNMLKQGRVKFPHHHRGMSMKMGSPVKESRELKDMPLTKDMTGKRKGVSMKDNSPAMKYDRVVLGGNKGDKSKTHKGKDY